MMDEHISKIECLCHTNLRSATVKEGVFLRIPRARGSKGEST